MKKFLSTMLFLSAVTICSAEDYVVQKGDYLGKIAKENNTTIADIAEKNNIMNPDIIYAGQKLNLPEGEFKMSIIHFNDVHSHVANEAMTSMYFDGKKTKVDLGGLPRVAQRIKDVKAKKDNTLVLHAGDALVGTMYFTLFNGEVDAKLMNEMGIDIFTLGNHEFDAGDEGLKQFLDQLEVETISANVVPEEGNILEGMWEPYAIKEFDGEKVGIIGIDVVGKTQNSSNPSDEINFYDETETVQKYVDELTAMGVNKIVVLSHYGYDNDIELAKNVDGVDVIVGGDSHSILGNYERLGIQAEGEYPTMVKSKSDEPVYVVQAWEYAHSLGELKLGFDDEGIVVDAYGAANVLLGDSFKRKNSEGKYAEVTGEERAVVDAFVAENSIVVVDEEPALKAMVDEYSKKVDELKQQVIGKSNDTLTHERIPGQAKFGIALADGSEIAPHVAKAFYEASADWGADIVIQNAGGIRISVASGEITIDTAYTLLPFANTLYMIEMTGSEIKSVLEDAVDNSLKPDGSSGAFPYGYNVKFTVDANNDFGSRITKLEIMNKETGKYDMIEAGNETKYLVVSNSYTAGGKDGYVTFKTVQKNGAYAEDTYLDYAESFVNYVKNHPEGLEKMDNGVTFIPKK